MFLFNNKTRLICLKEAIRSRGAVRTLPNIYDGNFCEIVLTFMFHPIRTSENFVFYVLGGINSRRQGPDYTFKINRCG